MFRQVVYIAVLLLGVLVGTPAAAAAEPACAHALVKTSVACVRETPGHASELGTQAVAGTPVKVLGGEGSWIHVELPDGYTGYVKNNSLATVGHDQYKRWLGKPRCMVTSVYACRMVDHDKRPVSDLYNGSVLEVLGKGDSTWYVALPDGRTGYVAAGDVADLDSVAPHGDYRHRAVAMARDLMGVSYLWGGTTTAAMDCSGLTKLCYMAQGVILPRNASQQALVGMPLGADWKSCREGDLVFFEGSQPGSIVHVGIYMGDGLYIHCAGMVRINSLDPESPRYNPANKLCAAVRIDPASARRLAIGNNEYYYER